MPDEPINVLVLCTHNAARSILAEAVLNRNGHGRFKAFSAGSRPRENQQSNPMSLQVLETAGIPTAGLHSKSWDEFGKPDAPLMDLVITVCDNAAGEVCPYWPGQPATANSGYADSSEVVGTEAEKLEAFRHTLYDMKRRLDVLVSLPAASVHRLMLQDTARGRTSS